MRLPIRRLATAAGAAGALVATAPSAATAAAAAPHFNQTIHLAGSKLNTATSNNWFGYNQGGVSAGGRFTSISGTWTVPTATRHSAADTNGEASSTWIGIGGGCIDDGCGTGATDQTLIQAGTEQDVAANGTATYSAWWEIIPEPETPITMAVHPGDSITVNINESVPGLWAIQIHNNTTGANFSTTTPYPGLGLSAEWIEETPLQIGVNAGLAALPNLSTVHFSGATANGANANLQTSQQLDLVDGNNNVIGTPSAPQSGGTAFDACAWATSCS